MTNGVSRVIEILVWALAIVSLIILILLTIGVSSTGKSTITNSYNTNTQLAPSYSSYTPSDSAYRYPVTKSSYRDSYSKPYIVDRYPYPRIYYVRDDLRYTRSYDRYLRYDDWGRRKLVKGIFGNDIDRYEVYVRNRGYTGGYFKVNFYFKDYYGRTSSDSITRYIGPRKESRFVFRDIYGDRYKHYDWSYEVISQTKVPTRVYYNTYSPRTVYVG